MPGLRLVSTSLPSFPRRARSAAWTPCLTIPFRSEIRHVLHSLAMILACPEVIVKGDARACRAALALCREAKVHRMQSEVRASDTLSTSSPCNLNILSLTPCIDIPAMRYSIGGTRLKIHASYHVVSCIWRWAHAGMTLELEESAGHA